MGLNDFKSFSDRTQFNSGRSMVFVLSTIMLCFMSVIVPSTFNLAIAPNEERGAPHSHKHYDNDEACLVNIKCQGIVPKSTGEILLLSKYLSYFETADEERDYY